MITPECTWGVTRQGEFQPCEKPAVARMYDPESAEVWSVCPHHTRKDALPMDVWLASEVLKAKAEALRYMGRQFEIASEQGTGVRDMIAAQFCYDRADQIERVA